MSAGGKRKADLPLPAGATVSLIDEDLAIIEIPLAQAKLPANFTPAEQEVATLVFEGLSNQAIATRRGTSPKTVGNQLERIYRKLGVASRIELIIALKTFGITCSL